MSFATYLQLWRADYATCNQGGIGWVAICCYGYNWATNPATLRTDREHRACRIFAKWCIGKLKTAPAGSYFESENGRLVPLPISVEGGAA